ncbi:hypothetical protein OUZ56_031887 [Daphnia magna]|uniref:Uncharacterized protein n=1 Tax=Daphnia magna TaxID=35525 RepID=A0ABQ9ZVI7_9CRUS|nr:hypothetical protein OUZ56_031887 [Daphnia magna]
MLRAILAFSLGVTQFTSYSKGCFSLSPGYSVDEEGISQGYLIKTNQLFLTQYEVEFVDVTTRMVPPLLRGI